MTTRLDPILVVDDSPELLDLIQILISNAGYRAVATQYPVQALELAKTRHFSALFTDLVMPVLNGHALIQAIRQTNGHHDLPVVVLSGIAIAEQKSSQPWIHHLQKPFGLAQFNAALEQVMATPQAR